MKVAVTGATGLIGSALCRDLNKDGAEVLAVTRKPGVLWDPERGFEAATLASLDGVDAVVHLAGESIAKRWSAAQKERIRNSRVNGSRALVEGLKKLNRRPAALVSASAVGYYGDRGDEELDESSSPGAGFLPDVCKAWEAETARAAEAGMRVAQLRFGIVLSTRGGALGKMLLPFKLGLGGPVGSGRQWMSWVHIDDVVGAIRFALAQTSLKGPANVTAPRPERNAEFSRTLGKVLKRPAFLPAPGFALKLAFGEMAQALLLEGQKVLPRALERAGYAFKNRELEPALADVIRSGK